jgi:hypothetical protein
MSISNPRTASSSDIELSVLSSQARSFQPPTELEGVPFSSPVSETSNSENRTADSIAMVDGVEPPTPAYFPPSNDIPPPDAGLLEYTRLHGHSEIPLTSSSIRQREDERTSVHASETSRAEALPAYREDNLPRYSYRRHDHSGEPLTWPAISFRIGFRTFLPPKIYNGISVNLLNSLCLSLRLSAVFPLFWLFGALTLVTPQGSLDRIFMPWFKDFAPSADSWRDSLQTEEEKEAYLARIRISERKWAKWCLCAFCLLLSLVIAIAGTIVGVSRISNPSS